MTLPEIACEKEKGATVSLLITEVPEQLRAAVDAVREEYPHRFDDDPSHRLRLVADPTLTRGAGQVRDATSAFRVGVDDAGTVTITYGTPVAALRGLGIVMGELATTGRVTPRREECRFRSTMVMWDVSRNAVLRPEQLERMLLRCALMGISTVLLYTEDTYEVPGEPLFGAGRGRYNLDELAGLDRVANTFGIELVPCIQTLGHLENLLKWRAYGEVRDTERILLADHDATRALLGRMIDAVTSAVSSKRIHLGLDEVQGLGSGAYGSRHGTVAPQEIYSRHLAMVAGLCRERGLSPMMWGDMVAEWRGDERLTIPDDMTVVNWDYYATEPNFCRGRIAQLRGHGRARIQAMAAFTWFRYWTQLPASRATAIASVEAAAAEELDEVMITTWVNDGAECDLWSALPAVQAFADAAWSAPETGNSTQANFAGSCDATLDTWSRASDVDILHPDAEAADVAAGWYRQRNPGKWLLWNDPVIDMVDVADLGATGEHYRQLAADLRSRIAAGRPADGRVEIIALLAEVLAVKVELHRRLRPCFESGSAVEAAELQELLSETTLRVEQLRRHHRDSWHRDNKSWGWELLDRRYGGLLSRLDTLGWELERRRADPEHRPEVLAEPPLELFGPGGSEPRPVCHDVVASASVTPRVGPR